jgi:hypothetical protein
MQHIDLGKVNKVVLLHRESRIKAYQLLYEWVKTKVINFETFHEAMNRLSDDLDECLGCGAMPHKPGEECGYDRGR